jgi:hypothetical protein
MKINGQNFEVNSKYIVLRLNDPYWSAYARFGWIEGTPGFSVNKDAIDYALKNKIKILVKNKYGDYEISPTKALKTGGVMDAHGVTLICIPKTAFKKLPEALPEASIDTTNVMLKMAGTPAWEDLRKKLHSK